MSAIINILEGGYGVSYLPYFVVQQAIEDGNLALIDVSCPDPELKSKVAEVKIFMLQSGNRSRGRFLSIVF